jgi:hypothetical protein
MKKQILIFAMLTLAIMFAGLNKAFGQDLDYILNPACVAATPLGDCAADGPLSPIPGQTYTYEINVDPTVSTGNVTWFVYNATANGEDIITGGSIAAAVAAAEADGGTSQFLLDAEDAHYNTTTTSMAINISWQSFDASTNEILLVAYVEGEDGCSDNIEVWRIEPTFAFTLDIAGLMPNGSLDYEGATNANECVSPVQEAAYDGTNLTMDYGENYIFFVVNAANFVHSWQPTFTVTSTGTTVDLADVTWAYPAQAIIDDGTGTWNSATTPILAQDATGAVGDAGECIIVRVYLDHGNTHENDVASAVTLGVDGIMYNVPTINYSNANLADLDPGTDSPCTNTETDTAVYDLTPRPNITEVTPGAGTFEPKN